jgi:hypothetical protein
VHWMAHTRLGERLTRVTLRIADAGLQRGYWRPNPDRCWLCLARPNETGEHRYKRSLVTRKYGSGSGFYPLVKLLDDASGELDRTLIRGPGSRYLKYPRSLCSDCNNATTQPMDDCLGRFYEHFYDVWESGLPPERVSLLDVFGPECSRSIDLLIRAFGKELGCRIREAGYDVPFALRHMLRHGWRTSPCLRVLLFRAPTHPEYILGKSPLYGGCAPGLHQFCENYVDGGLMVLLAFGAESRLGALEHLTPSTRELPIRPLADHPVPELFGRRILST